MTPPRGNLDFSFAFGHDGQARTPRPTPGVGHMVFVAPYSGSSGADQFGSRSAARALEVDTLSEAFRIVSGSVQMDALTPGGEPFTLPLADAEALHPDKLLEVVPALAALWVPLRDLYHDQRAADLLKAMLSDPSEHEAQCPANATAESTGTAGDGTAPTATAEPGARPPSEGEDALLGRLLGQRPGNTEGVGSQPNAVALTSAQELVQRLVQRATKEACGDRHGPARDTGDLRTRAEAELGRRLRAFLHQEGFRRVAASWFGTEMVVRACPDDSRARFSAVDASWQELVGDPGWLNALLADGVSLLVVDHCFGSTAEELCALLSFVRACHEHNVFLVTGAAASLAGGKGLASPGSSEAWPNLDEWQSDWSDVARQAWAELGPLREAGAQFALVLPRCLVRQPYGKRGEPLEALDFEELGNPSELDDFLWANGAYLVARALMEQWCDGKQQIDGSYDLKGLPVVSVADGDHLRMQPPLEAELPSETVEQLLSQGFSVIEAVRHTDRARVHL